MSNCPIPPNTPTIPTGWTGSTYLNSVIKSYDDVAYRVKVQLGFPKVDVEIADEQMASFINQALELYTRYAGYTEEFVMWNTTQYEKGLGLNLDRIINYDKYQPAIHTTTSYEVTSTSATATEIDSVVSLISSTNFPSGGGQICITYDPSDVWTFDVCTAQRVSISATSHAETTVCETTAFLAANNGVVTIYSEQYATLEGEVCAPPLSSYWGCDVDISAANVVEISGLPPCTLLGDNAIATNTGKVVSLSICNTAIDTQGPVLVNVKFKTSEWFPTELVDTYDFKPTSGGFKVYIPTTDCVPQMSHWGSASATFFSVETDDEYGYVASCVPDLADPDLGDVRKVLNVHGLDKHGTFGGLGENYLHGMDYAIASNLWGGMNASVNMQQNGFDLVTYELLGQYIKLAKRMLSKSTQYTFNKDTQYLKLNPEPKVASTGYSGPDSFFVISCYVEKPIAHLLKERWVLDYVLANTMISLGHIRGKFGQVTLFGGGTINASDVMTQGLELKTKLEAELLNGYGDSPPPLFLLG